MSMPGDGADRKKERYSQLARFIQAGLNQTKEIPLKQTVARFAVTTGLSRPKVMEYLEDLEDTGEQAFKIDKENDRIKRV